MVILDIPAITFTLAAAPSPTSAITPWIAPVITASAVLVGALLATVIGWKNVRAAQNKIAIDLFDRRLAAYNEINEKIRDTALHIAKDDLSALAFGVNKESSFVALYSAFSKAYFLFGLEVTEYLQQVDVALTRANLSRLKNDSKDDKIWSLFMEDYREVVELQHRLPDVFEPYLNMRTMAVRKMPKPKPKVKPKTKRRAAA